MKFHYQNRKGGAAVEAACCLPVLLLIMTSAIEISGGLFQEYDLQVCAYELSKTALHSKSTADDVQAQAQEILPQLGFTNYQITIEVEPRTVNTNSVDPPAVTSFTIPSSGSTTAGLDQLPRGTLLRLTIVADRRSISGIGFMAKMLPTDVNADCVFVKEF